MKETTIEPYLPMLERFEEFFREELASRLSVESVDSVMEAAVENFHRISAIIPDVPPTSPWVKNIIGIAYEIGLWQELSARGWSPAELSIVTQKALKKLTLSSIPSEKFRKYAKCCVRPTMCVASLPLRMFPQRTIGCSIACCRMRTIRSMSVWTLPGARSPNSVPVLASSAFSPILRE